MAGLRERGQCPWTAAIPWDPSWLCFSPKGAMGHLRASCDRRQPRTLGHSPNLFSRFVALNTDSDLLFSSEPRPEEIRPCSPLVEVISLLSSWRGTRTAASALACVLACVLAAGSVFCFLLGRWALQALSLPCPVPRPMQSLPLRPGMAAAPWVSQAARWLSPTAVA